MTIGNTRYVPELKCEVWCEFQENTNIITIQYRFLLHSHLIKKKVKKAEELYKVQIQLCYFRKVNRGQLGGLPTKSQCMSWKHYSLR